MFVNFFMKFRSKAHYCLQPILNNQSPGTENLKIPVLRALLFVFDSCMYSLNMVLEDEVFTPAEIATIQVAEIAAVKLMQVSLTSNFEVKTMYNAEVMNIL